MVCFISFNIITLQNYKDVLKCVKTCVMDWLSLLLSLTFGLTIKQVIIIVVLPFIH